MRYRTLSFIAILILLSFKLPAQKKVNTGSNETIICMTTEEPASYPGGLSAWQKHFKKHIEPLAPPCESGKIWLQFKVLKSGKTDSIQVKRGLCKLADNNAIEILKKSGLWHPACSQGKPVDSWTMIQLAYHYK